MTEVRIARPPGSAALDAEALHDLLATSFELAVGRPRLVRHTTLDTFDRRLQRAGRRLQLVADAGEERLELVVHRVGKASSMCSPAPGRGGRRWRAPFRTGR